MSTLFSLLIVLTSSPIAQLTFAPGSVPQGTRPGDALSLEIPPAGRSITFTVDTRKLRRAHLAASARSTVEEAPAAFLLELTEGGVKVVDGWDVCIGHTNTYCFANLELNPGLAVRTFTLKVRPRGKTPLLAKVGISVLDPLE